LVATAPRSGKVAYPLGFPFWTIRKDCRVSMKKD
jgi:hypothetical protein